MSCSDRSEDVYHPTYVFLYRCRLCRDVFEKKTLHPRDPANVLGSRELEAFVLHRRPPTRANCCGVGDLVGGYYEKER